MSSSERNQILEGKSFYGSNSIYFETEEIYEEKPKKIKTQPKTKPRTTFKPSEEPQQTYYNYSKPKNEDSGAWVWWVIGFFLFIWII